ncbi:hypothetical protein DFJ43DRAFT_1158580 [Lentinula guzmanii]|uniref:Uncharacterized protein n=1 Tax=Lentinula guzmanii TaxID=2804957 RepID=A0AA38JCD0_9AGAR|nr:hypothetical protein DFJ43DRAFT_1158580 [Lentinula guzmanii]
MSTHSDDGDVVRMQQVLSRDAEKCLGWGRPRVLQKEKEEKDRAVQESKTREEESQAKSIGALVRDSIARKEQVKEKGKENRSLGDDSVLYVGKKRKWVAMIPTSNEYPDDGDDDFEPEGDHDDKDDDHEEDEDPSSPTNSPRKSSKCDHCIAKEEGKS